MEALFYITVVVMFVVVRQVSRWKRLPPAPVPAELGDLTVLRIALDASARDELPAETSLQHAAAKLRELRPRWRRIGATDFDPIQGGEIIERFQRVLNEEDARVRQLAPCDANPFREGDRREVVLVVLVIAVREVPVLQVIGQPTLVTVGDQSIADGMQRALAAIAELPAGQLVGAGVIAGRATIADLAASYATNELSDVDSGPARSS